MQQRLLLVLDLDETLVYGHAGDTPAPSYTPSFEAGPYPVFKRPYVDTFLETVLNEFDVAVWTSASKAYAEAVVFNLFKERNKELKFVYTANKCTSAYDPELMERLSLKNLRKVAKLGYDLDRVIAVDDTPSKYRKHYGNLVRVPPFTGDRSDDILYRLLNYLRKLSEYKSVRKVDKRGWLHAY
jgi:RNA polymerase II subunit A small phosphatase-like protein